MRLPLLTFLVPLGFLTFAGAGCSVDSLLNPETKTIAQTSGTAQEIFPEALAYVKETYPDPILLGVNNSSTSLNVKDYSLPSDTSYRTKDGKSRYWAYIFARSPEATSDKEVSAKESVAVTFDNGKLTLFSEADIFSTEDIYVPAKNADWKVDSDDAVAAAKADVQENTGVDVDQEHTEINMRPALSNAWDYDITFYTNGGTEGFSSRVDAVTGEASTGGPVSFTRY